MCAVVTVHVHMILVTCYTVPALSLDIVCVGGKTTWLSCSSICEITRKIGNSDIHVDIFRVLDYLLYVRMCTMDDG